MFSAVVSAEPHAYPVPFTAKNPLHTQITFVDLPADGAIKIFTVDGRKVKELDIPTGAGLVDWDLTNIKGEKVATGVYLFDINGQTQGKLVVIR